MLTIRRSAERGRTRLDWLDSRHTFSFGDYHDPRYMGFGPLRVINEDRVAPGAGFGMHPHRDMEILTHVLEGDLRHRDTLGTGSVIRSGDWQRMSAGTGILHSEENASATEEVHFLQIWILPARPGLEPSYEERSVAPEAPRGRFLRVASREGTAGALTVHQDVEVLVALLAPGSGVFHELRPGRQAWLQVARGEATLNGTLLSQGDGAAVRDESRLEVRSGDREEAEVILFDLP